MKRLEALCTSLLSYAESLSPEKVLKILDSHQITYEDITSSIEQKTEGYAYGRKTLHRTQDVEILLLYWPPGVSSPIHDHGESYGVVHVIQGELLNENFQKVEEGKVRRLEQETASDGEAIVSVFKDIHRLSNQKNVPCISLHVYSPPLMDMGTYELVENQLSF